MFLQCSSTLAIKTYDADTGLLHFIIMTFAYERYAVFSYPILNAFSSRYGILSIPNTIQHLLMLFFSCFRSVSETPSRPKHHQYRPFIKFQGRR